MECSRFRASADIEWCTETLSLQLSALRRCTAAGEDVADFAAVADVPVVAGAVLTGVFTQVPGATQESTVHAIPSLQNSSARKSCSAR